MSDRRKARVAEERRGRASMQRLRSTGDAGLPMLGLAEPRRVAYPIEPADGDFDRVRRAARQVIELMRELALSPHVMTTGSRGLHVVAPLRGDAGFDEVRGLARAMAARLAERSPGELTIEQRKDQRRGRIYLDVMRNAYG